MEEADGLWKASQAVQSYLVLKDDAMNYAKAFRLYAEENSCKKRFCSHRLQGWGLILGSKTRGRWVRWVAIELFRLEKMVA